MAVVPSDLLRRFELAHARCRAEFVRTWMRREGTGEVLECDGGAIACFAGAGSPFNRTVGLGVGGPVDPSELDRIEEFYGRHGVAPRIDLCPNADPSLVTAVRERGYVPEAWFAVWARYPVGRVAPISSPPVSVSRVESREHATWVAAVTEGFRGEPSVDRDPIAETAPFVPGMRLYLARLGDEVAGGASVACELGIAVLGGATTRAPLRRRGVHTALLAARLSDASDSDAAILHAIPGIASERNAARAGFELAYHKLTLVGRFR